MSDAQKLINDVHKNHKPSRWRSFSNDNEILRCANCKTDFGRLTGKPRRNDPDPYDLWAEHVAAEIDKALGGLTLHVAGWSSGYYGKACWVSGWSEVQP
ncbi:hypothetical protein [Mycobacterium sp. 48b]|uniref:hypothetical protein n=1 Tax=Mycobacterium sp. 48b TaxID=3400426 RepID=UPI003AAAA432